MVTKYQIFSAFFSDIYEKVFYLHLLVFYFFFLYSRAKKVLIMHTLLVSNYFQFIFSVYLVNSNSLIIYNNMQHRLIVDLFFIFSDMKPPRVTTAPKVIWKSGGSKTPSRIHYFTRQTMGEKAKFEVKIQFLYS